MFAKALVFPFIGALQLMWLQNLNPDVKVLQLCSDVVVLIEIWSPPLLVRFSICPLLVSQIGCRPLEKSLLSFRAV